MFLDACTYNDDGRDNGQAVISDSYHELASHDHRDERPANIGDVLENDLYWSVSCIDITLPSPTLTIHLVP